MRRLTGSVVALLCMVLLMVGCSGGADKVSSEELDYYAYAASVFNANDVGHQIASALGGTQDSAGKVYASIGIAADYPDQVLITISAPGFGVAHQFMFDPANPSRTLGASGELSSGNLPESVMQWNATVDEDGYLLVDGREAESMP